MIFQVHHSSRMTPFQMKGSCCCSCYSVWTKRWLSSILSIIFREGKKNSKPERTKATLQSLQQRRKCFLAKIIHLCQWNLCQTVPLLPWLLQLKTEGKENPRENEQSHVPWVPSVTVTSGYWEEPRERTLLSLPGGGFKPPWQSGRLLVPHTRNFWRGLCSNKEQQEFKARPFPKEPQFLRLSIFFHVPK